MIKDVQQAEDLTHDTYMKAFKYISKNKHVQYPKTFLYRIAHNLTIDYIRKNSSIHMMKEFFKHKKDPGPSVESIVEVRESSKELYHAMGVLKTSYRIFIILQII